MKLNQLVVGCVILLVVAGCGGGTADQSTSGIATFPAVASTVTGSPAVNWEALENKPLHLPHVASGTACPVTPAQQHISPDHQYATGQGPVYLVAEAPMPTVPFTPANGFDPGSPWMASKQFWEIAGTYAGPSLIRGRQIDGSQTLGFNGGQGQTTENSRGSEPILRELRLLGDPSGQWKTYLTFVRVQTPGCYALQIDMPTASDVIVFDAVSS